MSGQNPRDTSTKTRQRRGTSIAAVLAMAICSLVIIPRPAAAQAYPNRPVKIIVPVAPGGTTDVLARIMAQHLQPRIGQPVIVENRAGGGYIVGMQAASKAPPDGHTLILTARGAMAVNPHLHKSLPYDPAKDFAPIALVASFPLILVVNPSLPVQTLPELLAYARKNPGVLNYGSAGNGSSSHLAMELLQYQAGVKLMHVPFKGGSAAMNDLLAGNTSLAFDSLTSAMPHVRAGKLRAIAIANPQRSILAPQLPTVAEGGVKDFDMSGWYGLAAPAGTPEPVIRRLSHEVVAMMADPVVRNALTSKGIEPIGKDAVAFDRLVRSDTRLWSKVVKEARIRLD